MSSRFRIRFHPTSTSTSWPVKTKDMTFRLQPIAIQMITFPNAGSLDVMIRLRSTKSPGHRAEAPPRTEQTSEFGNSENKARLRSHDSRTVVSAGKASTV